MTFAHGELPDFSDKKAESRKKFLIQKLSALEINQSNFLF